MLLMLAITLRLFESYRFYQRHQFYHRL